MLRVLGYILLIILVGSAFAWLASNSVDIIIPIAGHRIVFSLLTAISSLLVFLVLLAFCWWFIRALMRSPFDFKNKIHTSKKRRGEEALRLGLLAVFSGDETNANRLSARANKLLGQIDEPLQQLLSVRTLLLNNDRESAVRLYEQMRDEPSTKLIALQGLYKEAVKSGAYEAANQYAEEAANIGPTLKWANRAVLNKYAIDNEWDKALLLFDRMEKTLPKVERLSPKQKHRRAVLLTGAAMENFENKPDEALNQALKAMKIDRDFVPTSTVAASILFKLNEIRQGEKTIEAAWRREPHPDLARIYMNVVSGERAVDRLKRAKTLAALKPYHFESLMLIARTAFEADELSQAKENVEKAANLEPRESVFLLLADIEEVQSGSLGLVRQWLARALRAEKDPVWIADGVVFNEWAPISPISGRLDAFEWKNPMRHLGQSQRLNDSDLIIADIPSIQTPEVSDAEVIETATNDSEVAHKDDSDKKNTDDKTLNNNISKEKQAKLQPKNTIKCAPKEAMKNQNIIIKAPFFDGDLIEDDQKIPPAIRLNVDDPGVEDVASTVKKI